MKRVRNDRGAVAVELALVLPILILLMAGIIEVGRAFNAQVSLTNAARESVRVLAIDKNDARAVNTAISTADTLSPKLSGSNLTIKRSSGSTNSCPAGATVTVSITYTMTTLTGIAAPFSLRGEGVRLCGG